MQNFSKVSFVTIISSNFIIFQPFSRHIFFHLGSDWVDPDDPTVIAENELLGAAASIDAAAKKLANLRPRKALPVSLNKFDNVYPHFFC